MRIALLADIHGNLAALEAALAEIAALAPDLTIVAGDVVDGGPDSGACWRRVRALRCPVIRGNHERYLFDYGTPRADPAWSSPQFAPLRVARAELSTAELAELAALLLGLPEGGAAVRFRKSGLMALERTAKPTRLRPFGTWSLLWMIPPDLAK